METPAQRCTRLIVALEELVAQETATLRAEDWAAASEIAERSGPVVEWLVAHAAELTPPLRDRIATIRGHREMNSELLDQEIAGARAGLHQVATSRRRVAQIAPVYGRGAGLAPGRLSAVG